MPALICLGCCVLDRIMAVEELPSGSGKVVARAFEERGGGMAATAAVAAVALGGEVLLCARVGLDSAGTTLRDHLERSGVGTGFVREIADGQTGTSVVHISADGDRAITNFPGRNLPQEPDWLPLETLTGVGAVLADVRWIRGAAVLFRWARERGIPRVLDADAGDPEGVRSLLPMTDHPIFSAQGLRALAGTDDPVEGLRRVAPEADGGVGVTLGGEGSLWLRDGRLIRVPAFPVQVRNTNGSGDVFHGAYALALAEGSDPQRAAAFATAASGLKCEDPRGWDGMPSRNAVDRLLALQA
jgi:sulfofructose kinase